MVEASNAGTEQLEDGAGAPEDGRAERVPWAAPALLAFAGATATSLLVAGDAVGAAVRGLPPPSPNGTGAAVAVLNATGWIDLVAVLLLLVVGVTWWEAARWSAALPAPGSGADGDGADVGPAGTHLGRLRPLAAWVSFLLLVLAAAAVARVVATIVQVRTPFGGILAGTLAIALTGLLVALTVAVVGLAVASRAARLCRWWEPDPPDPTDPPDPAPPDPSDPPDPWTGDEGAG